MKASKAGFPKSPPIELSGPKSPRMGTKMTVGLVVLVTLVLALFWYLCRHSDKIGFLPHLPGAKWIVYPKTLVATRETAYPLAATFRRPFVLQSAAAKSTLTLYAYKTAALLINERAVALPRTTDSGWKTAMQLDVSEFLRAGTNQLLVIISNSIGPPALWLRLESGGNMIASDKDWEVSLAGSATEHACLARELLDRNLDKSLQGSERTLESLARIWPSLTILAIGALVIPFLVKRVFSKEKGINFVPPDRALSYLLGFILFVRFFVCFHNIPLLPRSLGFDAEAHEEYIKFVCEKHALPLAKDGWEMFQPPLYYIIGALATGFDGQSVGNTHTTTLLRAVNGVVGLLQCWLVLLCLKRLLPGNFEAQTAGLTIAAFLPPNLNLSHYITNEPLTALCATGAFYFLLRTIENEKLKNYIGLGVFLGLAMLTKFSALLIVVGACAALGMYWLQKRTVTSLSPSDGERARVRGLFPSSAPNFWLGTSVALACCLLICGWHYLRVWINTGQPIVGNWESTSPFAWRQDPGFHVAGYYLKFGRALGTPLFSSFHSFADGIYSTLWGDGLASGAARLASRPPWNYDWMNVSYLLAVPLSVITILGILAAVVLFFRERSPKWFFVIWSLGSFAGAILFMSLRVPTYAQVKAFYGMPALASFAAAFALGWKQVVLRQPALRHLMRTVLVTWVVCVAIAFWIREDNPETWLVRGICFTESGQDSQADENLSLALEKDADALKSGRKTLLPQSRLEAHFNLGLVFDQKKEAASAISQYRRALEIDPDFDGALNNLAWLLATSSQASLRNGTEAVALARRACDLTQDRTTIYIGTLAAAYAEAGKFPEALSMAEQAIRCATLRGQNEVAQKNRELLQRYRAGKPYRDPAGP